MKFIRQLMIILSISLVAELLEILIPIPVAASIYGLIIMLAGLMTGLIPLKNVENAADFLVEVMPVMFIPPAVGIMTSFEDLKAILVPFTVIILISTVLIMVVTGGVAQMIMQKSDKGDSGGAA